jgi:hypothetical protein
MRINRITNDYKNINSKCTMDLATIVDNFKNEVFSEHSLNVFTEHYHPVD